MLRCRMKLQLTNRWPDDMHERLRGVVKSNSIRINERKDELGTVALANDDTGVRFEALAARGNPKRQLRRSVACP